MKQEITIGEGEDAGVFSHVRPEVWSYAVSGLQIVKSWLSYRMKKRKGKASSPLDSIRPTTWEFDDELIDLLWVLDATIDRLPQLAALLNEILNGELFMASSFPIPTSDEQRGPRLSVELEEQIALDMLASDETEDEYDVADVDRQAA